MILYEVEPLKVSMYILIKNKGIQKWIHVWIVNDTYQFLVMFHRIRKEKDRGKKLEIGAKPTYSYIQRPPNVKKTV